MAEQPHLTPEMLVPHMGEYLMQKGLITSVDLEKALEYQQAETAKGNHVMLGEALVGLNLIERARLDQAVTEQIIQLRSALQAANRTLERRVEERTAELQQSNVRLGREIEERKRAEENLAKQLHFETLIADISSKS